MLKLFFPIPCRMTAAMHYFVEGQQEEEEEEKQQSSSYCWMEIILKATLKHSVKACCFHM